MKRAILTTFAVLALGALGSVSFVPGGAFANDKVTICHAAGLAGTTQYVTITIAEPAAYGPAGHFYENGTPRAGHEEDYFGPCETPPPSSEPSDEPSATPVVSPTPVPSASPSTTPAPSSQPTPTPTPVVSPEPSPEPSTTPSPEPSAPLPSAPATDV